MQTFFEDNWLRFEIENELLKWSFSQEVNQKIIDSVKINNPFMSIINAVKRMDLGDSPFVALSGGVDSQFACLALISAGIKFKAFVIDFEFNDMDTSHARAFALSHNIDLIEIKIDVVKFLTRQLQDYVLKYDTPSPQFNTHFFAFEKVFNDYNPSCIICGGTAPFIEDDKVIYRLTKSQNAWTTFSSMTNHKIIGNFLAWSADIAIPLLIHTPAIVNGNRRYFEKIDGMKKVGFNVTPQEFKFTGFEKVKKHFEELTGDGWAFEKMFRHPNFNLSREYEGVLNIPKEVNNKLLSLNQIVR